MHRFIFESDIPSWSTPAVLASRLDRWALAGFNTIILQVDDGHGATWHTDAWAADSRVTPDALHGAVEAIHARGLSVIACVSLAAFNEAFSHYPQWKIGAFQYPFYNFWNAEFRSRRIDMLADLVNGCDVDGIALDYLRTGREAIGDEPASAVVLHGWLAQVRGIISPGVPVLSVHHSSYASGVREGVNLTAWCNAGLIDGAVLFNYSAVFPSAAVTNLMASSSMSVWPLIGNYDWVSNQAVVRSGVELSRIWRRVQREASPHGIGVYLANLLTDAQAVAIKNTQRMVVGL